MTTAALRTERLTKRFGWGKEARLALDGLDLYVAPGQVYGFLGKNGAGKTTTVRILLDLMRPSGGCAYLFGADPRRERSVLRRVGALVEGASFYPHLSAQGNLDLLRQMSARRDTPPVNIQRLLERVGLGDRGRDRFSTYSTGMKQRLGIAAALLDNPDLVILDEPINGMDPVGVVEIRKLLRELVEKDGKTVFLSSHSLGEVEQICDRVAIIDQGRLVREGSMVDLLAGRGEKVRIAVGDVPAALVALNGSWQVREMAGEQAVEVIVPRQQTPEIVARLVAQHVAVFEVAQSRDTLEDLFLALVQPGESTARLMSP